MRHNIFQCFGSLHSHVFLPGAAAFIVAVCAFFTIPAARADTFYWSPSGGTWESGWVSEGYPGSGDDAVFLQNSATNVTLSGDHAVGSLYFENNARFQRDGGMATRFLDLYGGIGIAELPEDILRVYFAAGTMLRLQGDSVWTNFSTWTGSAFPQFEEGYSFVPRVRLQGYGLTIEGPGHTYIRGNLGGEGEGGALNKAGTGTLALGASNPDFDGEINLYSGETRLAFRDCLGKGTVRFHNRNAVLHTAADADFGGILAYDDSNAGHVIIGRDAILSGLTIGDNTFFPASRSAQDRTRVTFRELALTGDATFDTSSVDMRFNRILPSDEDRTLTFEGPGEVYTPLVQLGADQTWINNNTEMGILIGRWANDALQLGDHTLRIEGPGPLSILSSITGSGTLEIEDATPLTFGNHLTDNSGFTGALILEGGELSVVSRADLFGSSLVSFGSGSTFRCQTNARLNLMGGILEWSDGAGLILERLSSGTSLRYTFNGLNIGDALLAPQTINYTTPPVLAFESTYLRGSPTLNTTSASIHLGDVRDDGAESTVTIIGSEEVQFGDLALAGNHFWTWADGGELVQSSSTSISLGTHDLRISNPGLTRLPGMIDGTGRILFEGRGNYELRGPGPEFSGGVYIDGGMLSLFEDNSLGTGPLTVTNNGHATVRIFSAALTNEIFGNHDIVAVGASQVLKKSGESYENLLFYPNMSSPGVSMPEGIAGADRSLMAQWTGREEDTLGHVLALEGTQSDVYVLQMTIDSGGLEEIGDKIPALGWKDGDVWRAAPAGNSANPFAGPAVEESFEAFRSGHAQTDLDELRGARGFDSENQAVWAVLDFGGSFAPVAEFPPVTGGDPITVHGPAILDSGNTAVFTATGGTGIYSWEANVGVIDAQNGTFTAPYVASGSLVVTITARDADDSENSGQLAVTIYAGLADLLEMPVGYDPDEASTWPLLSREITFLALDADRNYVWEVLHRDDQRVILFQDTGAAGFTINPDDLFNDSGAGVYTIRLTDGDNPFLTPARIKVRIPMRFSALSLDGEQGSYFTDDFPDPETFAVLGGPGEGVYVFNAINIDGTAATTAGELSVSSPDLSGPENDFLFFPEITDMIEFRVHVYLDPALYDENEDVAHLIDAELDEIRSGIFSVIPVMDLAGFVMRYPEGLEAVEGASVTAVHNANLSAVTDSDGSFAITGVIKTGADYEFFVTREGYISKTVTLSEIMADDILIEALQPDFTTIAGFVTMDPGGSAKIRCRSAAGEYLTDDTGTVIEVISDPADGSYQFPIPAYFADEGPFDLEFTRSGYILDSGTGLGILEGVNAGDQDANIGLLPVTVVFFSADADESGSEVRVTITASPAFDGTPNEIFGIVTDQEGNESILAAGGDTVYNELNQYIYTYPGYDDFSMVVRADTSHNRNANDGYARETSWNYVLSSTATAVTTLVDPTVTGGSAFSESGDTGATLLPGGLSGDPRERVTFLITEADNGEAKLVGASHIAIVVILDENGTPVTHSDDIHRIWITLKFDSAMISRGMFENGGYVVFQAAGMEDLIAGNAAALVYDDTWTIDYAGGYVTFWTDHLSAFGIGMMSDEEIPNGSGSGGSSSGGCFIDSAAPDTKMICIQLIILGIALGSIGFAGIRLKRKKRES